MRFALAVISGVALAGCATTSASNLERRTYDFGSYAINTERSGCTITAHIVSKGPPTTNYTSHTLTIAVSGKTSAVRGVICEPVVAGGTGSCSMDRYNETPEYVTAGMYCTGWNEFSMN